MERPGGRIGIDPAILQPGHLARRPSVNDALGISIEKRQIQRLIDINGIRAIGNERMGVSKAVRQGASPDYSGCIGPAVCTQHTKVREQAQAPHRASCDDHNHQPHQQCCPDSQETLGLLLDRHRWCQRRGHDRSPGCNQLAPLRRLGPRSALGCIEAVWRRGVWVHGRLEFTRW